MIMLNVKPTLTLARESGIRRKSIGRINRGFIYLAMVEPTGLTNLLATVCRIGCGDLGMSEKVFCHAFA